MLHVVVDSRRLVLSSAVFALACACSVSECRARVQVNELTLIPA